VESFHCEPNTKMKPLVSSELSPSAFDKPSKLPKKHGSEECFVETLDSVMERIQAALDQIAELQGFLKHVFASIDESKLDERQRLRILALHSQTNALIAIPINGNQSTRHDLYRILRFCRRKSSWLADIVYELQRLLQISYVVL